MTSARGENKASRIIKRLMAMESDDVSNWSRMRDVDR